MSNPVNGNIPQMASSEVQASVYLTKYFSSVINEKPIETNPTEIVQVLIEDIGIDYRSLHNRLKEIIPQMFIYYMKYWPGWQKYPEYVQGVLTYQEWFTKFKQYLQLKLTNLARTSFNEAFKQYQKEELTPKVSEISPIQISIAGPPSLLNSLVFVNVGEDAIIKRHMGPLFRSLSIQQMMNWPFVEVKFDSLEFSFVRRAFLCVERYLSGTNEKIKFPNTPYIEKAEVVASRFTRQVIALEVLDFYMKKYFAHLETLIKDFRIPKSMDASLEHLRKDIEELGLDNTIATNTMIAFNIGKCKYVRSKQVKALSGQDDQSKIKYFEVITPKVELHVRYFNAVPFRKGENEIDFVLFNKEPCNNLHRLIPTVNFRCTFCNAHFRTSETVSKHFCQEHGMEQVLYCLRCQRKYEVPNLVLSRWKHDCPNA